MVNRFYRCLHSFRIKEALVDGVERIVLFYGTLSLKENRTGVHAFVGPEEAKTGFFIALDERPADGRGTS